jgi:hypothetical protein
MRPGNDSFRPAYRAFAGVFGKFRTRTLADFASHAMDSFQIVASQPFRYAFAAHKSSAALTQNLLNFAGDARHRVLPWSD